MGGELQHLPPGGRGGHEGGLGGHHAAHHAVGEEPAGDPGPGQVGSGGGPVRRVHPYPQM